ncbi:MAG: c-type cytochrome [Hyphomicrobium sp.]
MTFGSRTRGTSGRRPYGVKASAITLAVALTWPMGGAAYAAQDSAPAEAPSAPAQSTSDPDAIATGKALLSKTCSWCHAIARDDKSRHGKAAPFREIVHRYPLDNLEEALAEGIISGHPDMPEFKYTPAEIDAILAYLETLKTASTPK